MGRKKIQISRIVDQRNRQVTFTKRKFGLMKKAYELSVLCDCEIALIIFNSTNRLFQYASTDMDRVLLKYTEYSEPHESRTNSDILETLRKKGLNGCESPDPEIDDSMEPSLDVNDKYRKYEMVNHMTNRQRVCPGALSNHEVSILSAAQSATGLAYSNPAGSILNRGPLPVVSRNIHSSGLTSQVSTISHSGAGYLNAHVSSGMLSSPGDLNRNMTTRSPTPVNLGTDSRRGEIHAVSTGSRNMAASLRTNTSAVHPSSPMVTMANPGLTGHGLGGYSPGVTGYSLPDNASVSVYNPAGTVHQDQTSIWQLRQHPHPHPANLQPSSHPPLGVSSPSHLPHPSFPMVSVKSERASPHSEGGGGGGMFQHLSPCEDPKDYAKGFPCPIVLSRPPSVGEDGLSAKRPRITDRWQR
ncbi:myocyte-specific enhancer factor 2B [Pristis pectinata]|uniref:myocyte-specific enhancer factor 2B n=1 Tax=Pristis pectinata TaxID=685728 RepID=UPI00223D8EA4|nr:myocyte-specific enhancer factor 2B [Pristis pectinata]XP_051894200.1 myocyte-specific enhancer factor 2B [Pristis pectinata]XP_051894201.1 myocyte-specific enhancer factor 2B [Pristis pectinata]XP_051894203.1 myocyte-specific enhancer factor 2B [Pristis pectinata]